MGGALASAVAEKAGGDRVALADHDITKAQKKAAELGSCVLGSAELAENARFIFIGVKPQMLEEMFDEIKETLGARKTRFVLVSMVAGTPISRICELAGSEYPVIRIMPNTPVSVGRGTVLYTANSSVTADELSEFKNDMQASGLLDELPERLIDAASALSGSGPAFVYLFAEALADGAVECGLPRDKALLYAAQTISGAAELLISSGKHPGELKDAVCSPGGTTIAGVHALEDKAFRSAAMSAVTATYNKTLKL